MNINDFTLSEMELLQFAVSFLKANLADAIDGLNDDIDISEVEVELDALENKLSK